MESSHVTRRRLNTIIPEKYHHKYYQIEMISTYENLVYSIVICGALLNFLPFLLGYSLRDPETHLFPEYLNKLSSPQMTNSLVASLAISVPILFDGCFDYLARFLSHFKINTFYFLSVHAKGLDYVPFREVVFFIVIPDILFLFWIIPSEQYDILGGFLSARDTMFIYSFLAYMVRYKNPIWTWWTTIPIIFPLMSSNIILSIQTQIFSLNANIVYTFSVIVQFLVSTAFLFLTVNVIRWFWFVKKKFSNGKHEEDDIKLILMTVCAFCYYAYILGDWLLVYAPPSTSLSWLSLLGHDYLTMLAYFMSGIILVISVVSSRLTRIESHESKVS